MKTILHLICILTTMGAFVAYGQEAPADAKEAAKAIISKAKNASGKVSKSNEVFRSLCKQQEDGIIPMGEKDKEKLARIWSDRRASLEFNRQVAELLRVGNSVFSYPGLLALSDVDYDERGNKYSIRIVTDFKGYEGGVARHPTYRIVEFDEVGRIAEIKEFATVKMITK